MPTIHKNTAVAYTPQQMYQLVDDIESYPQFLPHCESSHVLMRTNDEVHATLVLAHSGLSKSFTTVNRLQPHKMIEIRLLKGPFKQLEGFWTFEALPDNCCNIVLNLEFEFSSKLLAMMFGPVFNQVALSLVDAFVKRASEVYV